MKVVPPGKRDRLMQALEQLSRDRQFHEIKLEDVARLAAVGKGTIYLHFADKEDLFFQTAVAGFDTMCALLREGPPNSAAFPERLRRMCATISEFFRRRRPLFRMILAQGERALGHGGGLRARWLKRRKRLTREVAVILADGRATGAIRTDLPADVLAEFLLGLLRMRAMDMAEVPLHHRTDAIVVDLFLHGAATTERLSRPIPLLP